MSLPFAEVSYRGEVIVSKADGSGGILSPHTCAEQLLYEVGDPANYITPDMVKSKPITVTIVASFLSKH